jgi:hypothetical protein
VKKYKDEVNLILKTRSTQIKDNPVLITNNSLNSGQSSELSKLSSIITTGNLMKSDLLAVIVPKDAVTVHLELLNTSSRVLADIESMKDVYSDPIKSLSGISQYNVDVIDFQNSLKNLNLYFDQKLGKNPN